MTNSEILQATQFVETLSLPKPPDEKFRSKAVEGTTEFLDQAKDQAAVVGSDIISFVKGVTEERRRAILDSALLAQLVANKKIGDPTRIYDWYKEYFNVLSHIGWVIQDHGFSEYNEGGQGFEAHQAVLDIAAGLLGPGTAALQVVKATLDGLKSLEEDSPSITLFNRESKHAKAARFQIALAQEVEDKDFLVTTMAFGLEASAEITQVLFFKYHTNDATLQHFSGKLSINTDVLKAVEPMIAEKISAFQVDFIRGLPDID